MDYGEIESELLELFLNRYVHFISFAVIQAGVTNAPALALRGERRWALTASSQLATFFWPHVDQSLFS
jgi:hypothetical protein